MLKLMPYSSCWVFFEHIKIVMFVILFSQCFTRGKRLRTSYNVSSCIYIAFYPRLKIYITFFISLYKVISGFSIFRT